MLNKQSPKFLLGLMTGIAIVSTVGFLIMTVAYFQKSKLVADGNKNEENKQAVQDKKEAPLKEKQDVKIGKNDYVRGDKKAKVEIVEFSDIQCPYCSRFHGTMKQVMDNYGDKVQWVFKHFPLAFHSQARPAALAAECAGEQGKYWDFIDYMYENQGSLGEEFFKSTAEGLKLKMDQFNKCVADQKYATKIDQDIAEGKGLGVSGTPKSFINGVPVNGAYPYEEVKKIIDEQLK